MIEFHVLQLLERLEGHPMNDNESIVQYVGKYRLVKFEIGGGDASEKYIEGWKDKSFYMYFEITEDGRLTLTAHAGGKEKVYTYYLDPVQMKYYLKADHSDAGIPITIENGIITEKAETHVMVYEITDELD